MPNINEEWLKTVNKILKEGETYNPRGLKTKEILNNHTCINMNYPILTLKDRKLGYKFMFREAWWILSGHNDVASIKDFSKNISNFSNDKHFFDGAYGPRVVEQLRYIVDTLYKDNDTRQAVLTIWKQNPRESKDIPCTISIQWFIRNNTIYCVDTMRSSDIWLGWPYDVFNFTMLTGYIMLLLRDRGLNNLKLGNLYLNAGSQHLYEPNFEAAKKINKNNIIIDYEEFGLFNPYIFDTPEEFLSYLKNMSEQCYYILDLFNTKFGRHVL